jgi:phosphatidylserine/phosphatidylglycerophosphate/cardiolipin synthase-like enzyme
MAVPSFNARAFQLLLHDTNAIGFHSLHQKSLLADETVVLFGTANLTTQSLDLNDELIVRSQVQADVRAVSQSHAALARSIASNAHELSTMGHHRASLGRTSLGAPAGKFTPGEFSLKFSNDVPLSEIVLDLLRGSVDEITCFASHSIDPVIYRELLAARRRGVRTIVVKGRNSLEFADSRLGSTRVAQSNGTMHIKAIAIDRAVVAFGSLNLFARSLIYDQELLAVSRDPALNHQILARLDDILNSSDRLSRKLVLSLAVTRIVRTIKLALKRLRKATVSP